MKQVLAIYSSLNGVSGNSSKLVDTYLSELGDGVTVTKVVLSDTDIGHLTSQEMGAWMTSPEDRTEAQVSLAAISDNFVEQVQEADEIIIGTPMYNFGIPSTLKAWIDRIARAGVTFKYTETGPVGLLSNKRVVVLAARGGMYQGTPMDTQTDYLTHFFNFVGLSDIQFAYAEGLAMGEDSAEKAFSAANEKIIELSSNLLD